MTDLALDTSQFTQGSAFAEQSSFVPERFDRNLRQINAVEK